jgi:hypothetical protein
MPAVGATDLEGVLILGVAGAGLAARLHRYIQLAEHDFRVASILASYLITVCVSFGRGEIEEVHLGWSSVLHNRGVLVVSTWSIEICGHFRRYPLMPKICH